MRKFTDYSGFKLQELLEDDQFIVLINRRRSDPVLRLEWEKFLLSNFPEAPRFREAAGIIDLAGGISSPVDIRAKAGTWEKLSSRLKNEKKLVLTPRRLAAFPGWKVAALFLLFLSAGGTAAWYLNSREASLTPDKLITHQSGRVKLPDHSVVTLSTNATLTYKKDWTKDNIREVWLSGEAHFEVSHLNKDASHLSPGDRFIVHVGNEMEVEVLGTVFTVKHSLGKTSVELETGSVKIALKNRQRDDIWLKPGEKIELDTLTQSVVRSVVASPPAAGIQEGFIELNNTSIVEIIKLIETNFHKKVIVRDSSILTRKIDGLLPMNKEDDVLFIISSILNVVIDDTDPGIIVIGAK